MQAGATCIPPLMSRRCRTGDAGCGSLSSSTLFRGRRRTSFYLELTALLLFVIALVMTLSVNVPIDAEIAGWTVDTLPGDWTATRDRWEFYHELRTFASLAGLGLAIASILAPPGVYHEAKR
jgi:uncharacterized membrane protein